MIGTKLVAGNWKMHLGAEDAIALARAVADEVPVAGLVEVALLPPFPWLLPVRDVLRGSPVMLGAQTCHQAAAGPFTGEVSAAMLASICDLVLAGHSERRQLFGESDQLVGEKVNAILASGAAALLCVGETLDERTTGRAEEVVRRQLRHGLAGVSDADMARVGIAYEPVWAIGTGVAATAADAQAMCAFVRGWLRDRAAESAAAVRVLYGGSVTPDNAADLFAQPDVNGALVGGASLQAERFLAIVRAGAEAGRRDR